MAVYVDDMYLHKMGQFKRRGGGVMKMSHMIADTHDELVAMADAIGVARRWIQHEGSSQEHFDVALEARGKAVSLGAIEITMRDLSRICRDRRKDAAA